MTAQSAGLPLWSTYPEFVRRHRILIGALIGLGLLAGLAISVVQPVSYSATASVVLTPVPKYVTPSTTTLVPPAVTIDTDAQLLQSPPVVAALAGHLGVGPGAVADHVAVSASPNTRVLHVTVTAGTASAAASAANAAVAALGEVRRASLGSLHAGELRQLRLLIDQQEQLVAQEQVQQVVVPTYDSLASEVLQLKSDLNALEEARTRPLEIIDPASPPRQADYRNTEVPVVSGAMVGFLLGCLLGAARDRLGSRVPRRARLTQRSAALGRTSTNASLEKDYHHAS